MAQKRRKPYYMLRPLMSMVLVVSRPDGRLLVDPRWRKRVRRPGLFTRLAAAQRMEKLLNDYLARRTIR